MSHCNLLLEHTNSQPQICSSNMYSSQNSVEYNHWLSSMAYGGDVFSQRCHYNDCLSRQCLSYELCPRFYRHGLVTRRHHENIDGDAWPTSHVLPGSGCGMTTLHDMNAIRNIDTCGATTSSVANDAFLHSLHTIHEQRYSDGLPPGEATTYSQQSRAMRASGSWISKVPQTDFRNESMFDDHFDFELDTDELSLHSDYNITSTLCGLEEVLSRLI